jgi:hypothetical protein
MKKYNVHLKPHKRTSLLLDSEREIGFPVQITARNKAEAKEMAEVMVQDYYSQEPLPNGGKRKWEDAAYMAKQYGYIIDFDE